MRSSLLFGVCLGLWLATAAGAADATDAASQGVGAADRVSREVAERLAAAMRFETISYEDPTDFRGEPFEALFRYLAETYPRTHATLGLERINDYTLLFEWKGSDPELAPALFMSHTDVVPVEESARAQWTHPPFAGVIADGFAWGRGALDVKIGVILWLEAVEALIEQGFRPRRTLYFSFGHDEEIGGFRGAAIVAKTFAERGIRLAFLFDEGGSIYDDYPLVPDRTTASIVTAEKAYYTVSLRARGVSGHSSIPPESTAIGRVARAIARVEENPMPARLTPALREMFEAASSYQSSGRRFAFRNLWLTGGAVKRDMLSDRVSSALVRTTFAVTLVSGGVKDNVIPELAEATINVRILPGDTPAQVLAHLTKVIDDPEIEIEGESWGPGAPAASVDGAGYRLAEASVLAVAPDVVVLPGMVPGATDSRHFAEVADEIYRFVPYRIGVEQLGGAHGRDERIAVGTLAESRAIAIEMVRRAGDAAAPADGALSE